MSEPINTPPTEQPDATAAVAGAAPCSAFEIVDCTDDEQYFPLGHWLTLADAIAALDTCKDPDDLPSDGNHDDSCKVEIRKHKLGWSGHGRVVYRREWAQKYDEAKDEYEWYVLPNDQAER
jgi:hypothetical protein